MKIEGYWRVNIKFEIFCISVLCHSPESTQSTDYIVIYFFLNVRVSKTKIENLK